MTDRVRTAIFPVAGLGTRLLPATKSVPKELLPIFDTPLLQFAIDEAISAGIERLVFVSHPSKSAIEDYLCTDQALLATLEAKGKTALASALEKTFPTPGIDIRFVYQHEPLGLGHAVLCARDEILDGPVAVILPDDLILGEGCMSEMIRAYADADAHYMIAAMKVDAEMVSQYGIFDLDRTPDGQLLHARGFVEKPTADRAPSRFAAVGRYILPQGIFDALAATKPGAGGEIQLTDAIAAEMQQHGLRGFLFAGTRYDCGCHEGLLAAGNAFQRQRSREQSPALLAAQ